MLAWSAVLAQSPAADQYFQEIEGHFAMRRNTPFILSAKDWALMKKWHEEGIPLPVVIEAIDQVFEKNESSGRHKVISSLSYCRHAVKELWNDRKSLQVGEAAVTPEEGAGSILHSLAADVAAAEGSEEVLQASAEKIRALVVEKSVPCIEEALIELERDLVRDLLRALPPAEADQIQNDVTRAIADAPLLDEKTRQRTEEANLRRLVRERFALPRLTLFR